MDALPLFGLARGAFERFQPGREFHEQIAHACAVGLRFRQSAGRFGRFETQTRQVGRVLKKGETFGVVESIKAVSDLYSPLAGKVLEINSTLIDEPARINQDPQAGAWLLKLELTDPASVSDLMDAAAYSKYVETLK